LIGDTLDQIRRNSGEYVAVFVGMLQLLVVAREGEKF
jgi:hypothetical protein